MIINTVFFVFFYIAIGYAVFSSAIYFMNYFYLIVHVFAIKKIRNKRVLSTTLNNKGYKYCIMIAAHNEEKVILQLVNSIRAQTYQNFDLYVVCDNCTDRTVQILQENKVAYFERHNLEKKGANFAIQYAYAELEKMQKKYDYYFYFDADNLLDKEYLAYVNDEINRHKEKIDVVTTYRNSKNYGSCWISAGYSLQFMRESAEMNAVRNLLGMSQFINGTGFCVSRDVLEETNFWTIFNTMSHDIEFTSWLTTKHFRSIYVDDAIFYDEQPVNFKGSWVQRMRWAVGFKQVRKIYLNQLFTKSFDKKTAKNHKHWNYWDKYMIIFSGIWIFVLTLVLNAIPYGISFFTNVPWILHYQIWCWIAIALGLYASTFIFSIVLTITEWKRIKNTSTFKKILYIFTYPIFMETYIPISFVAIFRKKYSTNPIARNILISVNDLV